MKNNFERKEPTAKTPELAVAELFSKDVSEKILYRLLAATSCTTMAVLEFDGIAPNGSLTYFNSKVGNLQILSLILDLPSLDILISLEDDDVPQFLNQVRVRAFRNVEV